MVPTVKVGIALTVTVMKSIASLQEPSNFVAVKVKMAVPAEVGVNTGFKALALSKLPVAVPVLTHVKPL